MRLFTKCQRAPIQAYLKIGIEVQGLKFREVGKNGKQKRTLYSNYFLHHTHSSHVTQIQRSDAHQIKIKIWFSNIYCHIPNRIAEHAARMEALMMHRAVRKWKVRSAEEDFGKRCNQKINRSSASFETPEWKDRRCLHETVVWKQQIHESNDRKGRSTPSSGRTSCRYPLCRRIRIRRAGWMHIFDSMVALYSLLLLVRTLYLFRLLHL